jgi:hypothetical protein
MEGMMRRVLNINIGSPIPPNVRGLETIPEHVFAIMSLNVFDPALLKLLTKQISHREYTNAVGTIDTMRSLVESHSQFVSMLNPKDEAYLRLNSIKKCLTQQ